MLTSSPRKSTSRQWRESSRKAPALSKRIIPVNPKLLARGLATSEELWVCWGPWLLDRHRAPQREFAPPALGEPLIDQLGDIRHKARDTLLPACPGADRFSP